MPWKQLKDIEEKRGEIGKTMHSILKTAETEKRELTTEERAKFDELSPQLDQLNADVARYKRIEADEHRAAQEDLETREQHPGRQDLDGRPTEQREQTDDVEKREEEHRAAFDQFLRHGGASLTPEQRSAISASDLEKRAVSVSGFGVVGARGFYNQLVESMDHFAGVREAGAEVISTSNGNEIPVPTADDTAEEGQILAESAEETNTDTNPNIGNVLLNSYKYSSKFIRISLELLQDNDFNAQRKVIDMAGRRIGRAFNKSSTSGDGTDKPRGFVVAAAGQTVEAAANASISYDDLLDLQNGVDAAYWKAPKAGYMMSQSTLIGARKLKDLDGRPIWTPAFGEMPERINGYPVTLNNELGNFGAAGDTVVAAFGDWHQYKVRDVTRPVILRLTEKFAEFGQVGFLVFSRHDGDLADAKAIALLDLPAA